MKKRYVKIFTVLLACTLFLSACKDSNSNTQTNTLNTSSTSKSEVSSGTKKVTSAPVDLAVNPESDFEYEFDSNLHGVKVSYIGNATTVRFPDTINGDPVVAIGQTHSTVIPSITAVSIPEGIKVIGAGAFDGYTGLTNVSIPNSVTLIDLDAFQGCTELTDVVMPDSLTVIETGAFQGCKGLLSITIPDGVLSIGSNAFMDCADLTSVTIPDSVISIDSMAFYGCNKLSDIVVPDTADIDSEAFKATYWYERQPDGLVCIGTTVLGYKGEKPSSITLTDGVTSIGVRAFQNYSELTSVTIPDGVTRIGKGAFFGCSKLTSITIPDSMTEIDKDAFYGCSSLDKATKNRIRQINPDVQLD